MNIDIADLVGIPFVSKGRNPATGLDCWGLVVEVGKRMGKKWEDFYVDAFDSPKIEWIHSICEKDVVKTHDRPEAGFIVGLRMDRDNFPGYTQHYGVCLNKREFIHTLQKTGSIITRFDHPFFKNIITGYYEW